MIKCEKNLLGICLKFPDNFDKIINYKGLFNDQDVLFYFEKAKEFYLKNNNLIGFQDYIIDSGFEIIPYLEIVDDVVTDSSFEHYLSETLFRKIKREIKGLAVDVDEKSDYIDIIGDLQDIIDGNSIISDHKIKKASEICPELFNKNPDKVYSGITLIDNDKGGYEKDEFIIIAARPSVGKTAKAIDLIKKQLQNNLKIGMITCEMSSTKIMRILACNIANINETKFDVHSDLEKQEIKYSYVKAVEKLSEKDFYIDESGYFEDIVRNIKIMIKKHKVDCIYIDHLHHILTYKTYKFERDRLQNIIMTLKYLTRTYHVPIILLAQLNRGAENTETTIPKSKDIKGCGDAEQIADIIGLLHCINKKVEGNASYRHINFIIDKNRNGQIGTDYEEMCAPTRRFIIRNVF